MAAERERKAFLRTVERARISDDGSLGEWQEVSSLRIPRGFLACVESHGFLYAIGGGTYPEGEGPFVGGSRLLASVEKAEIRGDGSLSPWNETTALSTPKEGIAIAVSGVHLYVLGGSREGIYLRTAEYATVGPNGDLGFWK